MYVIIHTTEGSFHGAVSWLKDAKSGVSAHYVVRNSDGFVKQLVHENDRAYHAKCWNQFGIGIEMEGYEKQDRFSDSLYRSVSQIVAYLSGKYSIPIDNMHVVGHDFWKSKRFKQSEHLKSCNDHGDPGNYFNWDNLLGSSQMAQFSFLLGPRY